MSRAVVCRVAILAAWVVIVPPRQSCAQTLFSESFEDGLAAGRWFMRSGQDNGLPDFSVNLAFNYATIGIPSAPRGSGTIGAKLDVNLTNQQSDSELEGLNIYPNLQSFSGDFVLKFDVFSRVAGTATTEDVLGGINASGNFANWFSFGQTNSDGLFYGMTTDGGNAPEAQKDYVRYTGFAGGDPTATALYDNTDVRPQQILPDSNGTPANQWVTFEVRQIANKITWKANGQTIDALDNTSPWSNGNIFLGYQDLGNSVEPQTFGVFDNVAVTRAARWNLDADATWNTPNIWSTAEPNAPDAIAYFGPVNSVTRQVLLGSGTTRTVGALVFDSLNTYSIAGSGTLNLAVGGAFATIDALIGEHFISVNLVLSNNTVITVADPAAKLHALGNVVSSSVGIVKDGAGQLEMRNVRAQSLYIADGTVRMVSDSSSAGTSGVKSLRLYVPPGANTAVQPKLDLARNALAIDYTGTSPLSTVRSLIVSAYHAGAWDGRGITSSNANAAQFGIGYAEASALPNLPSVFTSVPTDSTTVLVRFTRYGDADLSGTVGLSDFNRLASNFGQTGRLWSDGDFNYDGTVNLTDFNRLASNFGLTAGPEGPTPQDWAALAAVVPEPASAALLSFTALLIRRRGSSHQPAAR